VGSTPAGVRRRARAARPVRAGPVGEPGIPGPGGRPVPIRPEPEAAQASS